MSPRRSILLISPFPELLHDQVLIKHGYEVTTVSNYEEARRIWSPEKFNLVLVLANGTDEVTFANEFCEELKREAGSQRIAVLTGWNTYVPRDVCPDEIIRQSYSPESFLSEVSRLV